ncbi:MAG TPA: GNAT family N-acetyltransferase [Desulfosporosinus sp.]|nr:GNAT family N-acetyltransferase [Desulfosporosinus sp.]
MEEIRLIAYDELDKLLCLYRHSHADDPELAIDNSLKRLWDEIFQDKFLYYLVAEEEGELVSSCTLAIIKNLTRNARPYGLIENVVTHPDYRKKGYGTRILKAAIEISKENNCYKVMLLTSSKKKETLRFYEKAGFNREIKTGFIFKL